MSTVRWNVAVSADTDKSVRMHLASRGGKKGDLSRFIEDAVKDRIFDDAVAELKAAHRGMSEQEIADLVDEAIAWARNN